VKIKLTIGWVMIIPVVWAILSSDIITSGDRWMHLFAYGVIGFCIGTMQAITLAN